MSRSISCFCLLLLGLLGCAVDGAEAGPRSVGPEGGTLELNGVTLQVPAGAVADDTALSVAPLKDERSVGTPHLSGEDTLVLTSKVYAFTPHGTKFAQPVAVALPYEGKADMVVRREGDKDAAWERMDGATFKDGLAHFEIDGFSYYATVRRADGPSEPQPGEPWSPNDPDPNPGSTFREGELAAEVHDSGTRSSGTERTVFDNGRLYWTQNKDGMLGIYTVALSGSVPAAPQLLWQTSWVGDSGWTEPPLLVTSQHLMFPLFGTITGPSGSGYNDGWAALRKDGSGFIAKVWENWWVGVRGDSALMLDQDFYSPDPRLYALSLETGAATALPANFAAGEQCAYDPQADELGCAREGTFSSYRFADSSLQTLASSADLASTYFGSILTKFNATHWFTSSRSGDGRRVAAVARDGSGVTYYPIDAPGAVAVDDSALYACLAGELTRVSLQDQSQVKLSDDCATSSGVSILGCDATYVYYLHRDEGDPVDLRHTGTWLVYRIAKTLD